MILVLYRFDGQFRRKAFRREAAQVRLVIVAGLNDRETPALGQRPDIVVMGGFVGHLPGGGERGVENADRGVDDDDGDQKDAHRCSANRVGQMAEIHDPLRRLVDGTQLFHRRHRL